MAKTTVKIKGLNEVRANLRKVTMHIHGNSRAAMVETVATIQRESMRRTPVDTGNLMGGHRTKVGGHGKKVWGIIYVLANYALFVHEAPPSTVFKSKWPRGRKYLERAITDNLTMIKANILKWVKV